MKCLLTTEAGRKMLLLGNEAIVRGALAATGHLPFSKETLQLAPRDATFNQRAFQLGVEAAQDQLRAEVKPS